MGRSQSAEALERSLPEKREQIVSLGKNCNKNGSATVCFTRFSITYHIVAVRQTFDAGKSTEGRLSFPRARFRLNKLHCTLCREDTLVSVNEPFPGDETNVSRCGGHVKSLFSSFIDTELDSPVHRGRTSMHMFFAILFPRMCFDENR